MQNYAALKRENAPQPDREHQLWNLKNQVGSEFRTYILSSGMFPQSKIEETKVTNTEYHICTTLSKDTSKGITAVIEVSIVLMVDPQIESATKLIIQAIQAGNIIFEATWTEMYDAQSAFEKCQASMLDILDQLLSEEHED